MNWSSNWDASPSPVNTQQAGVPLEQPQINLTPSLFPEWDAKGRDEVLAEWEGRQKLLAVAKEREMSFRKYVVQRAFPQAEEGTNTVELNNGYNLKAVVKYNYKLAENKIVEEGLDKLSTIGNNGSFIADILIGWTPTFYVSEYREIVNQANEGNKEAIDMLKIISSFLTINEAAPTLEIKSPKSKK